MIEFSTVIGTAVIGRRLLLLKQRRDFKNVWWWRIFKEYMNLAHVGVLHNRQYFEKYRIFNERYKIPSDCEFILFAKNDLKAEFLNKVKRDYRGVNTGSTMVFKEIFKAKNTSGGVSFLNSYINALLAKLKYFYHKSIHNYE